jgi:hypothetical protein
LNLGKSEIIAKQDTLEKVSTRDGSGAYKDNNRLSVSLPLLEFNERTGDLSQLVLL